jgi:hypothetical protein
MWVQPVDRRPAREAQAEDASDLVEGLAGGVIDGLAEPPVMSVRGHEHYIAVAAGYDERQQREQGFIFAIEPGSVDVTLEVVHGYQGH